MHDPLHDSLHDPLPWNPPSPPRGLCARQPTSPKVAVIGDYPDVLMNGLREARVETVTLADEPDVVIVVNVGVPEIAATLRELRIVAPWVAVVAYVRAGDGARHRETVEEAIALGAVEFVTEETIHDLPSSVTRASSWSRRSKALFVGHSAPSLVPSDGPVVVPLPQIVARLQRLGRLSPVQTITVWWLLWGETYAQTASRLRCSARTVKYHVSEVLRKTGARSVAQLLCIVMRDAGASLSVPWARRQVPLEPTSRADADAG